MIRPSPGQRVYEHELLAKPLYDDGTPRKPWAALSDVARWSWERNPSPRWSVLVLLLLALAAPACSLLEDVVEVQSDTAWRGTFNGRTVEGTGSQSVSMGSSTEYKCATVRKLTAAGTLTVSVRYQDLTGPSTGETTTAPFGAASVCTGLAWR